MPHLRRNIFLILFTALLGLPALHGGGSDLLRPAARAAAAFNVNSTGDAGDSDLADGVCNDGSGQCTLRAAVQQANQLVGDDAINITASGTISLTSELPRLSGMTLTGPGPAQLTVRRDPDAATFFGVFRTESFATVGMSGLTVSGGRTAGNGGGIYNSLSAALVLSNVVVSDNAAENRVSSSQGRGGGIFHEGSSLTLTNCAVSNNTTSYGYFGAPADGRDGGGIYARRGVIAITNSTVSGNKTVADNVSSGAPSSPSKGGGIFVTEGVTGTLTNSTVSGNRAGAGGGIFNSSGTLTLNSCTVVNNTAVAGFGSRGGGFGGALTSSSVNSIRNTIVADNTAAVAPDLDGFYTSEDFNLIRNTSGVTFSGATTHNLNGVDPLLSPLQNNGGPTQTHALLPGSPAIDAGDGAGLTADQRGLARPTQSPGLPSLGNGARR